MPILAVGRRVALDELIIDVQVKTFIMTARAPGRALTGLKAQCIELIRLQRHILANAVCRGAAGVKVNEVTAGGGAGAEQWIGFHYI